MNQRRGRLSFTSISFLLAALPDDVRRATLSAIRAVPFAAAIGIGAAFLWPKEYLSTGSFVAESQNGHALAGSLGALADEFGIAGSIGGGQSPAFFADLLVSRAILLPILAMPVTAGEGGDTVPLLSRLDVGGRQSGAREERGLRALRGMISVTPDAKTGVVTFGVTARDPQLAHQIAEALLRNLDQFNVGVRRSRAGNERAFLEERVSEAQSELRGAEGTLEQFLNSNRADTRSSPSLAFREARLRRNVDLTQTRFVELRRQLDQARIQEVRDTPALTVLDRPNLPHRHYRPRRSLTVLVTLALGMLATYAFARFTNAVPKLDTTPTTAGP